MSWQRIELNMIPDTKVLPVVHASQFDSNRSISFQMFTGEDEWIIPEGLTIELHCRKVDDNIVTLAPFSVDGSVITFITNEQLTACSGQNKCELSFIDANDLVIGSLNFILDVEPDPLKGGLTSASSIYDLTQQIKDIAEEVIGNDYYNKTETDALLADKADKSELPDMTDYYTKTQTDNLLNDKADRTDLATLASKAEVTQAISDEDTALKNWVSTNFATSGYVATHYYSKLQVDALLDNIFPTLTASGPIASFTTALNKNLVSVTHEAGATTITRCGKNLFSYDDLPLYSGYFDGTKFYGTPLNEVDIETVESWQWVYYLIPVSGKSSITLSGFDTISGVMAVWLFDLSDFSNFQNAFGANEKNGTHTIPNNAKYLVVPMADVRTQRTNYANAQAEFGSTATAYEPYNGQTVPVADATTLTTLSGINYVFADSGNVTVQYKYMSM